MKEVRNGLYYHWGSGLIMRQGPANLIVVDSKAVSVECTVL